MKLVLLLFLFLFSSRCLLLSGVVGELGLRSRPLLPAPKGRASLQPLDGFAKSGLFAKPSSPS